MLFLDFRGFWVKYPDVQVQVHGTIVRRIEVLAGLAVVLALAVPAFSDSIFEVPVNGPDRARSMSRAGHVEPPEAGGVGRGRGGVRPAGEDEVSARACPAGLKEAEEFTYYDVHGNEPRVARASYEDNRPHGKSFDGFDMRPAAITNWRIGYLYCRRHSAGKCRVTGVETVLKINYLMPRWADHELAAPEDQQHWNEFYDRLLFHEKGHGRIAREGAALVHSTLTAVPEKDDCEALDVAVKGEAHRVMSEIKTRQRNYDRDTRHGLDQGIRYPFR